MSSFAGDLAYRVVKEKLGALIQAASGSPSLRAQLVANPKQAVEDFLGLTLPAGVKVRAIEEDADTLTIVVPRKMPRSPGGQTLKLDDISALVGAAYSSIIECPAP